MKNGKADTAGLPLAEALEAIRRDIAAARVAAADADIRFKIERITVELKVVAVRELGGHAGFRVPVVEIDAGASGSVSSERTSTITVELGPPADREGRRVPVASQGSVAKG